MMMHAMNMLFKFAATNPTTLARALRINPMMASPAKIIRISATKLKKRKIAFIAF
jgi:hypothetical protein